MRSLAAAAAVLIVSLTVVSCASAQPSDFINVVLNRPGTRQFSQTDVPVSVSGAVSAEYRGTPAAGCASHGLCGISGTTVWTPGRAAVLMITRFAAHGRRHLDGTLFEGDATTATRTRRATPNGAAGLCGDVGRSTFAGGSLATRSGHALAVRLLGGPGMPSDVFSTQCAAPLANDLVRLLPVRPLSRSVLHGSGATVDLSTTRPFSADGFSGTLRSTVVLRVGRPRPQDEHSPTRFKMRRLRATNARYRIESVSGSVSALFRALAAPDLCAPLDACGASGRVEQLLSGASGTLELLGETAASRPARDMLKLFGVAHAGNARHVEAHGGGAWRSSRATVESSFAFGDGAPACSDEIPLRSGVLTASLSHTGLRLAYVADFVGPDGLKTRCPGPVGVDVVPSEEIASGSVPLRALRRPVVTVRLRKAHSFSTASYAGEIDSALVVRLRRVKVRSHVLVDREPIF